MTLDEKRAIWEGQFSLFGVMVRCYVLADGQRILDAESVHALFEAMSDPDVKATPSDIEAFARWVQG